MAIVKHLSYSSITTYLTCARKWHFRYMVKPDVLKSPNLVFGSAFHSAVEAHITEREQDGVPLVLRWDRHWGEQLEKEGDAVAWDKPAEEYAALGQRMLSDDGTRRLIEAIKPVVYENKPAVEVKIDLHVPGVPVPIIGYIDVIEEDGIAGDFKTSARSWTTKKANEELQPSFYLAALNQMGFESENRYWFRYYVFVKTKQPKVQLLETTRDPGELFWLMGLIKEVWDAIEAGVFPPNPTSWLCGEKYCEYWSLCRGAA